MVVDVAYRYFELPRDPRLRVSVGDGRQFLASEPKRWDAIVIDAFFADAIPFHLVTREFLDLARSRLEPRWRDRHERDRRDRGPRLAALPLDLPDVPVGLPDRARPPGDPPGRPGATRPSGTSSWSRPRLRRPSVSSSPSRWDEIRRRAPGAPDLAKPILDRHDAEIPTGDVPTLTDDYAPTDALLLLFQ